MLLSLFSCCGRGCCPCFRDYWPRAKKKLTTRVSCKQPIFPDEQVCIEIQAAFREYWKQMAADDWLVARQLELNPKQLRYLRGTIHPRYRDRHGTSHVTRDVTRSCDETCSPDVQSNRDVFTRDDCVRQMLDFEERRRKSLSQTGAIINGSHHDEINNGSNHQHGIISFWFLDLVRMIATRIRGTTYEEQAQHLYDRYLYLRKRPPKNGSQKPGNNKNGSLPLSPVGSNGIGSTSVLTISEFPDFHDSNSDFATKSAARFGNCLTVFENYASTFDDSDFRLA